MAKRGKRGESKSPPVKENEIHQVVIEGVNQRGEGVARIRGFVVLVPDAKPGERLRVKIVSVRPRFAIAEALR